VSEHRGIEESWDQGHTYALSQAVRFAGRYIYFCQSSLTHWISPIVSGRTVVGALLAGPVLSVDEPEFFQEEFGSDPRIPRTEIAELREELARIPYVDPKRVRALSEMLHMVGVYLSKDAGYLEREDQELEIQSELSDRIQQLKIDEPAPQYPLEKEKELISAIRTGDQKASQRVLNDILGRVLFQSGGDTEAMKARLKELVIVLSRAAVEGGADVEEVFGLNFIYLKQLDAQSSVDTMSYWLSRIIRRFADSVFIHSDTRHGEAIRKSVDFVRRHYPQRIALDEVASHAGLSTSYFSRVFKAEMDENFISYLNRFRIEKAKELLRRTALPLVDVSAAVGFEDQSYFTKVFKRLTGTSPGRFRDSGAPY
jgi:AraC-like DNA-binding protein